MSPLKLLVLILMVGSLVCSACVFVKMLREISEAEGKKGGVPWLAVFGGGLYFLRRYNRSVPDGRTAIWFLLLLPIDVVLVGLFLILGS
jgi:hypothetical protein